MIIGIQCSKCGDLQYRTLSLFDFSCEKKISFYCECESLLLTVSRLDRGYFKIEFPCIYCGQTHQLVEKRENIWGKNVVKLKCMGIELPIGYIGLKKYVDRASQEMKKMFVQFASKMVEDDELDGEFDNFFIVYSLLEKLSKMAEKNLLGCRCGNKNLIVEVFADRIELYCERCEAIAVIYISHKEVLRIIDNIGMIFLKENMTWYVNSSYKGQNKIKNN